jgi:hypothetical protein
MDDFVTGVSLSQRFMNDHGIADKVLLRSMLTFLNASGHAEMKEETPLPSSPRRVNREFLKSSALHLSFW